MRKSLAQRGCGRQRVNDISHGAEAHDEQAIESRSAGCGRIRVAHSSRGPSTFRTVSRFSQPQPRARTNDLGGRVILGITNNDDAASTGFDLVALGDALRRVVRALSMKVRMDFANDRANVLFRENYDGVTILDRRQNFRAFLGGHHRPALPLQGADGSISGHRDNQFAAEVPSGTQVTYVANTQQIEKTIGQWSANGNPPPVRNTPLELVA